MNVNTEIVPQHNILTLYCKTYSLKFYIDCHLVNVSCSIYFIKEELTRAFPLDFLIILMLYVLTCAIFKKGFLS